MRNPYKPSDWYWIVGGNGPHREDHDAPFTGDETKVWSSRLDAYVPSDDAEYVAWRDQMSAQSGGIDPTTRIDTEANLRDVLVSAGLETSVGEQQEA